MYRSLFLSGSIVAALLMGTAAVFADSPREFLYKAQQGSNSEIMMGRLASEKGRSRAVREFGQTLMNDHRQARDEVRNLGSKFGVRPSREPSQEAKETMERLRSLDGRRFDREFVRAMVEDHEKDVAEFRDEAREGHGPVSDLARRQLPTLRHHLEIARSLENREADRMSRRDRDSDGRRYNGDRQDDRFR